MARQRHRPEFSFGSGSFLDVLCNMVGILIILIAVVGMRVADPDDPVVDLAPASPEVSVPDRTAEMEAALAARKLEIAAQQQQVAARRQEIAARKNAYQQELAAHEEEARTRQAEWQRMLAEMQMRNRQLAEQAQRLQQQIQTDAARVAAEEDKRLKLAGMVASAVSQNADLQQNETDLQRQALDLMQRRKEIQAEIEAQKVARAIRKPVFQIVARDGNSGTMRRPVLIECRSDGLEFASEKINISARDLNEFAPDYNPLLAGTEALLTYWTLADAQAGETRLKPYVLLIVRPGGTVGFYVARKYLDALNQDYGYELVPEGTEIQWPAADPQAVEICRKAVDDVMNGPRGSVARRFSNGSKGNSGPGEGSGQGPVSRYKNNQQIVGNNGNFQLPEVEELRKSSPRDAIDMLGPEWSPQRQKLAGTRPGAAREQTSTGSGPSGQGSFDQAPSGQSSASTGMPSGQSFSERAAEERASRNAQNSEPGMADGQAGNERRSTGGGIVPPAPSDDNEAPGSRTSRALVGVPERSPDGTPSRGDEAERAPRLRGVDSSDGRPQSMDRRRPEMPSNPLDEQESRMPRDGGRERHWGQGRRSGVIGIEKEIVMHLYPDRISINNGPSADLPPDLGREEFYQIVAAMIQVQANSWGEAPAKFSWRPRLNILIHPGGNQHYARLKELLQHWGLSSKIEQVLD